MSFFATRQSSSFNPVDEPVAAPGSAEIVLLPESRIAGIATTPHRMLVTSPNRDDRQLEPIERSRDADRVLDQVEADCGKRGCRRTRDREQLDR